MSAVTAEGCATCRFFKADMGDLRRGLCRRQPPQVVLTPTQQGVMPVGYYPVTASSEWCGEFRPKEQLV